MRRLLCLVAVSLACSSSAQPDLEHPPLGADPAPQTPTGPLTEGEPVDLSGCSVVQAGERVTDLRCDPARLSEFRAERTSDPDAMLDEVMKSLAARYGAALDIEASRATLDGAGARIREFRGTAEPPVSGIVVSLDNAEGLFWALACYREDLDADLDWCRRAIATVARRGGAKKVGARQADPLAFAGSSLTVPEGCDPIGVGRIGCPVSELSWTSGAPGEARAARDQTLERLRAVAEAETIAVDQTSPSCRLAGVAAECQQIVLRGGDDALIVLTAVATVDGAEILAVCTHKGDPAAVPPPCDQVLTR